MKKLKHGNQFPSISLQNHKQNLAMKTKTAKSNQTIAQIMKNLPLWLGLLLATLVPHLALANLAGPYTAETNTLFLLHIDSAAGTSVVTNYGSKGGKFYTVNGNGQPASAPALTTMLGAPGYSTNAPVSVSYNTCMTNLTASSGGTASLLGYDVNGNGTIDLSTALSDAIPMSSLGMGGTNNWTIEFLLQPNSKSTTAGTYHIMSTDDGGNTTYSRGFQFKMVVAAGPTYTLQWTPVGVNPGGSPSINGAIPTIGDDAPVPGQWYHLAMSYDGANVNMYWTHVNPNNGACHLISTTPLIISNAWANAKGPLILGNYGRGVSATIGFPGCYDELRISSVCRAANQMQFFSPAVSITQNPAALQNVDYNGPVAFTVGASTTGSSLYYQWRFNSNNIAGATNTTYAIPNVAAASAGYYDCVVTNTLGYTNVTTESHVVVGAANFMGHRYSFTTDDTDSISGANGTNFGNAYVTGGHLVLDGTSGSYMQLPPYLFNGASGTALTVEFWATFGANNNSAVVYDFGAQNTIGGQLEGYSHLCFVPNDYTTGLPQARISASDLAVAQLATAATPLDNQTVHVAVIYDPPDKTEAIYTNGVLAAINTNVTVALSAINNAISYVGRSLDVHVSEGGGPVTPYFAGSIDEFRVYYGALNVLSLQQSDNLGPNQVLADGPVKFATQPASTAVSIGNTATFTASAVGYLPIAYQWFTNGIPVPDATNVSFSFVPSLGDNNDQIVCYATNTIGVTTYSTNSVTATLLVVNPATVIWTANSSAVWDASSLNWTNSNSDAGFLAYGPLDWVIFDDEFNAAGTVDLAQAVNPQSITMNSTGTYKFISSNHQGALTGPGTLALNNTGTVILDVTNNLSGAVTISSGTLQLGNGDTLGSLGNSLPMTDNGTLAFDRSDAINVGNAISGSGGVNYLGSGTVNITAQNAYSGATLLANGTLHLGAPENAGIAGPLGTGGTISLNGGWLQYSAINSADYSSRFSTADGQVFNVDTAGQNVTWATGLGGAGTTLTKVGSGTLTLSGGNTYTGNTVISNGTLQAVSLAGNLTMASGTTLVVGGSNIVTTLSVSSNLTLNSDALVFDLTNLTTASTINVAGDLTPNGVTTIVLSNPNLLPNGTYPLLKVAGTLGGTAANFTVASQSPKTYSIAYVPGTPNQVVLQVSGQVLAYTWIGNGGYPLNGGNNYWDINTSTNWGETGSSATPGYVFTNGYPVAFDDTATLFSVNLPVVVSPSSVVVNAANNYTFSGAGGISGATGLTTSGTGTLTVNTVNSYTGPTTVAGGTLVVSADNALGTAPGTTAPGNVVINSGTLGVNTGFTLSANRGLALGPTNGSGVGTIDVPSGQTLTYGGIVANNGAGTGGLTLTGAGALALSGANTYTGTTIVGSGELDVTNWSASVLGTTTVGNVNGATGTMGITGGTLNLGGNAFYVGAGTGGIGVVNQSGGTLLFNAANLDLLIGNASGSTGTYNLSGGTLSGTFTNATRGVMLGVNPGNTANFNLSGSGVLNLPNAELAVGRNDSAVTGCTVAFNQTGGAATVGYLSIGGQAGATGTTATFSLRGGTFTAANLQNLVAAAGSSATLTLGGSAQVTLPAFPTPAGTANLTFDFTTGYLAPYAASTNYLSGLTTAALTTNGLNINVGATNNITIAQTLADATSGGVLTKSGTGTLTLAGTNTYTGNTTTSAGTLLVNGSLAGPVNVQGGATLGGSGAVGSLTNNSGGTLAPGGVATFGALTVTGNLTLQSGSTNTFDVNGSTPTNDLVSASGTVTYGGVLNVVPTGVFASGQTFTLCTAPTQLGNFSSIQGNPGSGLAFSFTNGVLSVVNGIASNPTNITASISGGVLTLTWPQDHLGWLLQSNSVSPAAAADWVDLSSTAAATTYSVPVNPALTNVFYRLRHP